MRAQQANAWVKFEIVAYCSVGNNAMLVGTEPSGIYQAVPEFPSLLILSLLMFVTLLAAIVEKRKKAS